MLRYTFREVTRDGAITGYAVERLEGEIGAFKKHLVKTYSIEGDRRSPDLISAYHCAKSLSEALNG
jgi:hypothetical protein